jgi:hypothetical protein
VSKGSWCEKGYRYKCCGVSSMDVNQKCKWEGQIHEFGDSVIAQETFQIFVHQHNGTHNHGILSTAPNPTKTVGFDPEISSTVKGLLHQEMDSKKSLLGIKTRQLVSQLQLYVKKKGKQCIAHLLHDQIVLLEKAMD